MLAVLRVGVQALLALALRPLAGRAYVHHQLRPLHLLGEGEGASVQRVGELLVVLGDHARAGAARPVELDQLEVQQGRDLGHRAVQLGREAAADAPGPVGDLHAPSSSAAGALCSSASAGALSTWASAAASPAGRLGRPPARRRTGLGFDRLSQGGSARRRSRPLWRRQPWPDRGTRRRHARRRPRGPGPRWAVAVALTGACPRSFSQLRWRERMGVEPTALRLAPRHRF